jgi:hypothetical protein
MKTVADVRRTENTLLYLRRQTKLRVQFRTSTFFEPCRLSITLSRPEREVGGEAVNER